jgi:hypothetical protein
MVKLIPVSIVREILHTIDREVANRPDAVKPLHQDPVHREVWRWILALDAADGSNGGDDA